MTKRTVYRCSRGDHAWTTRRDAERCCHPDWARLVFGLPGAVAGQSGVWVPRVSERARWEQSIRDRCP